MDQAGLKGSIILQSRYLYPVFFLIDNIHNNQCGGGRVLEKPKMEYVILEQQNKLFVEGVGMGGEVGSQSNFLFN